jgi:peptidoglycan/LPS O-acetylase OafA/YrhL
VLLLCRFRRLVVPVTLGLTAASLAGALLLLHGGMAWMRIYVGTDTRASAMLLGCALAIWWSEGRLGVFRRRHVGAAPGILAIAALMWCSLAPAGSQSSPRELVAWVVGTVAGAIFVVSVAERERSPVSRFLGTRVMVYLGKRSYALYLWHYVWLTWFRSLGLTGVMLALAATLACAELSWRVVESRFLPRGSRADSSNASNSAASADSADSADSSASAAMTPPPTVVLPATRDGSSAARTSTSPSESDEDTAPSLVR